MRSGPRLGLVLSGCTAIESRLWPCQKYDYVVECTLVWRGSCSGFRNEVQTWQSLARFELAYRGIECIANSRGRAIQVCDSRFMHALNHISTWRYGYDGTFHDDVENTVCSKRNQQIPRRFRFMVDAPGASAPQTTVRVESCECGAAAYAIKSGAWWVIDSPGQSFIQVVSRWLK